MKGRVKKAVKRVLRKAGWELKRASEVNSAVMKGMQNSYYSCWHIENSALVFNARIDQGGDVISMCCEPIADIPKCSFDGIRNLTVSRNTDIKYCFEENDRDGLLHAAARLLAVCQKHKIECDMEYAYTPAERSRIKMLRQTAGLGD